MKRKLIRTGIITIVFYAVSALAGIYYTEEISKEKLMLFPVPADFRNYFFLQSVDGNTSIIIGDFTGEEQLITHIFDKGSKNEIIRIFDYYPETKKIKTPLLSESRFFTSKIKDLKRSIITGDIFRKNYSYRMKSLETLMYKLKDGSDIYKHIYGYSVKFYDPDAPTTIMSEFFFGKQYGKYDLIFKTNYYKIFKQKIEPVLLYSVYCKASSDPVVGEVVESLLKMVRR